MRKRSCTFEEYGVGIYSKTGKQVTRNDKVDPTRASATRDIADKILSRDSSINSSTCLARSQRSSQESTELAIGGHDSIDHKLTETQQVLDLLDQQIGSLNALQQKTGDINRPRLICAENESFACHVSVDNLLSVASESPSPQARLQVLDYYVKHSINEVGTGDCGCRYDYASGGNVLTKLDECVGSRFQSSAESAPPTSSSQSKQQPGNKQRFSSSTFRSPQSSRTSPVERSSWHDSVQSALGSICSLESDPQGNNNDHRFVNHNQHLFIDETYGRNRSATAVTDRQSSVKANTAATISYPAESRRFQGLSGLTSGSHHSRFNSARSSLPETYNELCHQQTTSEVFGQTWSSLPPHQHCSNGLDSFIDVIRSSESETFEEEEVLSDTSNALESLVDSFDALSRRSPSPFCNQSDPFTNRSNGRPTADYLKQDIPTESTFRQHHRYNCLCIESVQAKQSLNNNNNNHPPLPCCQDLLQTSPKLDRLTRSSESCDHNQGDASNCSSTNCKRFHYLAANIQHQQHLHLSSDSTIAVSSPSSSSSSSISEENQVRKRRKLDPTEKSTTLLSAVACCSKASPLNSSSCGYHSSERLAVHKMGSENSDIININRSKRRDFFTTSSTKIEEKDSRLKHNNTQAVGSAKSLGRDLANVGLRQSNSSNCSSSAYALSSPVDGFLAREKEEEVDSMKAVRDIAKMSAPSLSSLQYLPSQVDAFAPSLKQIKSSKKTKKKMSESENEDPNKGNLNPINVITESRENLKHSESCLLDRLCLCNCMARSHHDIPSKLSLASQQEAGVPSSTEATLDNKQQAGSGSPLELNRDSKRAKSYSSDTSTTDDGIGVQQLQRALSPQQSRRVAAKISRENEKQSPSFLNILKSPSAHISRYSRELRRSQQRLEVCREDSSLGSSEELAASEAASSSRNSDLLTTTTTGNESGSSFAFNLRARSSSFATSGNRASSFLSSGSGSIGGISKKDEDACLHSSETVARPQSAEPQLHKGTAVKAAASTRGRLDKQSQKVSTYKKFLSPSKLFATGGNKSTNQGNLRPPSDISGGEVDVDDQRAQLSAKQAAQSSQDSPNQSSSFFVRSLHRLSGRKSPAFSGGGNSSSKRKRHDHEDKSAEHEKGIHQSHSACVSPTISISTASQQVDSLADSINSLDEEVDLHRLTDFPVGGTPSVLDKSRLFLAPEVRLRRVERNGGDSDADRRSNLSASSAYEMTRTHSNHRCRTTNQHDNIYQDTYSPVRYGSEFSDYTSDASVDRAYSVPASPSARRRTSGRSRTQRLAQSPVPFRSPATQSTKIEDGLKVCSTEHFEKHIGNIKDNQEEAQKNLFRTWINHFCPNLIHRDLVEELRDGIKLIGLLAYLTRDKQLFSQYDKLARDKRSYINRIVNTPSSKLRHLSNVSTAIDYLRKNRGMKLINLNPMDIVSGKPNVILGLCWNIILNFQLEQNYLNSQSIDNSSNGSQLDDRTSRFSSSDYAIDESPKHYSSSSKYGKIGAGISPAEEYSCSDLVVARKKLLDFINKRFDLKLTNLTSNLLDGDVMLVIIKNLLPQPAEMPVEFEQEEKWKASSNDEKLDYCFDLAQNSLNVPRLFSASDLRQQTISDNNSKPLLVYLTMLLSKDPKNSTREATTDVLSSDNESIKQEQQVQQQQQQQQQEDHQEQQQHQDQQPLQGEQSVDEVAAVETKFNDHLVELEKDDRFAVDRLQSTLAKIRELDNLIESRYDGQLTGELDSTMVNRFETLKNRANQIEALIGWINQADALFETTQKSACDLTNSIQEYREFFSPGKVPAISTQLCPTLERQYRECLGTARQRVLVMEQTLKNWYDYEKARQELRDWLSTAEIKLTEALQPIESSDSESQQVEQHTDRLKEVIDYFDLETIDVILNDQAPVNLDLSDRNRLRMSYESLSSRKLCLDDSNSISGSVLSLGSTSSRISTLQSSSKAAHNRLLDNFELKCRLLATMLDAEQKEALLLGVKELKARLKYITEHRVPQVVGELRFHINRLEPEVQVVESSAKQSSEESFAVEKAVDEPKVISKLNQNKSKKIITPPVDSKAKKETHKQHSRSQKQSQKQSRKAINNSRQPKAKKTAPKNIDETSDDDISITRKVWHKIVRAYRASFSLNIVLLICLAGICVVPLIHREACCELVTNHIYYEDSSVNTKPT